MNASGPNEDDSLADIASLLDFYTMVISGSMTILLALIAVLVPPDASDGFIGGLVQWYLNLVCDLVS